MTFIIVLIIIVVLLRILCPWLQRWMVSRMQRRAEDYLRRATGFPPREEESRRSSRRRAAPRNESRASRRQPETDLTGEMQKVAEDVEFVEYHEYSESVRIDPSSDSKSAKVTVEQQVTDAEYVVIPNKEAS